MGKPKAVQGSLFALAFTTKVRQAKRNEQVLKRINELQGELATLYSAPNSSILVQSPVDAAELVLVEMSALISEELWTIHLNTRNRVLSVNRIYRGSVNNSQVRVGELFRLAIIEHAASLIVLHNHPSGDPTPSPDDAAVTRAIVESGKLLDINVLDHLVIGGKRFVSLKERGIGF